MGWKAINNRHAEESRKTVDLHVIAYESFGESMLDVICLRFV